MGSSNLQVRNPFLKNTYDVLCLLVGLCIIGIFHNLLPWKMVVEAYLHPVKSLARQVVLEIFSARYLKCVRPHAGNLIQDSLSPPRVA